MEREKDYSFFFLKSNHEYIHIRISIINNNPPTSLVSSKPPHEELITILRNHMQYRIHNILTYTNIY